MEVTTSNRGSRKRMRKGTKSCIECKNMSSSHSESPCKRNTLEGTRLDSRGTEPAVLFKGSMPLHNRLIHLRFCLINVLFFFETHTSFLYMKLYSFIRTNPSQGRRRKIKCVFPVNSSNSSTCKQCLDHGSACIDQRVDDSINMSPGIYKTSKRGSPSYQLLSPNGS
jgi:hypothetical protein